MRDSKCCTGKLEKLKRDDKNLVLHLQTSTSTNKKRSFQTFARVRVNYEIQTDSIA